MVPGVYITAALTSGLAAAMARALLKPAPPEQRRGLLWAFLLALPLEPLSYVLLRKPLMAVVGPVPLMVRMLYAPLTEEVAKLAVFLSPAVPRRLRGADLARLAGAIGCGFGIGEAWLVAWFVAQNPEYRNLPFYLFGGYAGERLLVCLCHSGFVALTLYGWWVGHSLVLGLVGAMGLHLATNLPIGLAALNLPPLGKAGWTLVLSLWPVVMAMVSAVLLASLASGRLNLAFLKPGRMLCPGCGQVYTQPILLGLNLGLRRYERCSHCRRWHLVGLENLARAQGTEPAPDNPPM